MYFLRTEVIRKTLNAHVAENFDIDLAAEGSWKRLLTSSSYMGPMTTFVRSKWETAIENKKYSILFASKELVDTVERYKDGSESMQRGSEPGWEEPPRRK